MINIDKVIEFFFILCRFNYHCFFHVFNIACIQGFTNLVRKYNYPLHKSKPTFNLRGCCLFDSRAFNKERNKNNGLSLSVFLTL